MGIIEHFGPENYAWRLDIVQNLREFCQFFLYILSKERTSMWRKGTKNGKRFRQQKIRENGVKFCTRYVFCASQRFNWNAEISLMRACIFIQRRLRRPLLIIWLNGIRNNSHLRSCYNNYLSLFCWKKCISLS